MNKALYILIGLPSTILSGWVVMKLWGWFIVPLGLQPIQLAHAIGIDLILSFVTHQYTHSEKEATKEEDIYRLFYIYVNPLTFYVIGLIAVKFM